MGKNVRDCRAYRPRSLPFIACAFKENPIAKQPSLGRRRHLGWRYYDGYHHSFGERPGRSAWRPVRRTLHQAHDPICHRRGRRPLQWGNPGRTRRGPAKRRVRRPVTLAGFKAPRHAPQIFVRKNPRPSWAGEVLQVSEGCPLWRTGLCNHLGHSFDRIGNYGELGVSRHQIFAAGEGTCVSHPFTLGGLNTQQMHSRRAFWPLRDDVHRHAAIAGFGHAIGGLHRGTGFAVRLAVDRDVDAGEADCIANGGLALLA